MTSLSKTELKNRILFWKPECVYTEINGIKLSIEVDPFNNHINWVVSWSHGGYEYSEDFFSDLDMALDYFGKKCKESENGV